MNRKNSVRFRIITQVQPATASSKAIVHHVHPALGITFTRLRNQTKAPIVNNPSGRATPTPRSMRFGSAR